MLPTPLPTLDVHIVGGGDSFPAWAAALVAGGFALLGVVLTILFNRSGEKRKYEREKQQRFYDQILEYGSALIQAGDELHMNALILRGYLAMPAAVLSRQSNMNLVDDLSDVLNDDLGRVRHASSQLRLIAPVDLREPASAISRAAVPLFRVDRTPASVQAAADELGKANIAFQAATRKHLQISDKKRRSN